ncbi:MAG TPA: thiamine phosphate synthase [Actinomycetota bacterium]|nr:thiamine phosphate synthase [Actinomycetota bacterium]
MKPAKRRDRLAAARLYLVTGGRRPDIVPFLEAVLAAGVDIVQLREKDAEAGEVMRLAEPFVEAAERHGALFVVNDRADIAAAVGADGLHVGQDDLPVAAARELLGPEVLIGLSTHSASQLDAAPAEADYLCAGPVWETPTKPGRPAAGLAAVRHAAATARRPWFAIGGIDTGNLPSVVDAGARRIVVVRAITQAPDAAEAVRALRAGLPD